MTDKTQDQLALVARILMIILFLLSGLSKIIGFTGTVGYISSKGLPLAELGAVLAIVVEVGGALALALGFRTRAVATIMALFTLAAGFLFHNFWAVPAAEVQVNQVMFLKNLSIAGGLLMFAAFGAGRLSLDGKKG